MLGDAARANIKMLAPPTHLFIYLSKYRTVIELTILLPKNHGEELKMPFDLIFKFVDFKGIFIVLLCIFIVYYFLYLYKYQNTPNLKYNNKKIVLKI